MPPNTTSCTNNNTTCPAGFNCFQTAQGVFQCLKDCQPDGGTTTSGSCSVCLDGVAGSRTYCIDTIVCVPQSFAYNAVADAGLNNGALYGCGLTPK